MNPSIKVAQPGWNVTTCPDWALVFNSDWPSLTIAFETTIAVISTQNSVLTVPHNLGFIPIVMGWFTLNNLSIGRVSFIETDNTSMYFIPSSLFSSAGSGTLTIRCYNIDITKEAIYPLPSSASAKQAPDLTTYFKVVKDNRSITSRNMNDFILNSQCQSPAILNVATQAGQYYSDGTITYPLQTSYVPWVTAAVQDPVTSRYSFLSVSELTYSNGSLVLGLGNSTDASLVVLRDPLFYPNTVRVVF